MAEELLTYDESRLLRDALDNWRLDVWEYFREEPYPAHRAQKAEVEQRVAAFTASWDAEALQEALRRHDEYLGVWAERHVAAASSDDAWARLAAFAELQSLIEDSRAALQLDSYALPRPDQPLGRALAELHDSLSRDGLFRLRAEHLTDAGGSEPVFRYGDHALFPDPRLRPLRELLFVLCDLAAESDLAVWVALDPYRLSAIADVTYCLLADQWSGIQLTQANLDALDAHAVGTTSYHVAVSRSKALEFFYPLVATSFDWTARRDDQQDAVKRLYVREFKPPTDGRGNQLVAVSNRELHAERDTASHAFTHVDGKVRRYPAATYGVAHLTPRGAPGAHSHSRKLWRVDGRLSDSQWCDLVGLHFRHNELVAEHFRNVFPDMG